MYSSVHEATLLYFFGVRVSRGVMWQTYRTLNLTKAEIAAGIVPDSWLALRYLFFVYHSYNTLKYLSTRHIVFFFLMAMDEFWVDVYGQKWV